MKRRYKFINWVAVMLGCEDLIDYDRYSEVVPPKPYTEPIPEGLVKFNDDAINKLMLKYPGTPSFHDKLKEIGFGREIGRQTSHYEEPKE